MKKIVIDTNIVFSTLLNSNSRIGQIVINGYHFYNFIAPEYLLSEILKHQEKIKEIGGLTEAGFLETFHLVMKNIHVVSHSLIPSEDYQFAESICSDIDVNDIAFVALAKYSKGVLWTGDKTLIKGLNKKGADLTISTEELYGDFIFKRMNKKG